MTVLRESPWYQEILEEGREQGLREGLERGLEQGVERGLEQGVEQGLEQARRDDLQRVLAHRFGALPADIEAALQRLDLGQLERLFELSLEVSTLDEFRAHLPPTGAESDGDLAIDGGG